VARSRVDKRPQTIRDLADIAVYLARESGSDDLAFRFLDAAEVSFAKLAAMPAMGVAREYRDPELEGVRMWRITGFDSHVTSIVPLRAALRLSE
jgi:plasmid stabilization system protein ParE